MTSRNALMTTALSIVLGWGCLMSTATAKVPGPPGATATAVVPLRAEPLRWNVDLMPVLDEGDGMSSSQRALAHQQTRTGLRHFKAGRWETAVRRFRGALAADAHYVWARFHLARSLSALDRPIEAVVQLAKISESHNPDALVALEQAIVSPSLRPLFRDERVAGTLRIIMAEVRAAAPTDASTFAHYLMRFKNHTGRVAGALSDSGYQSAHFAADKGVLTRKVSVLPQGKSAGHAARVLTHLLGCVEPTGDVAAALGNWRAQHPAHAGIHVAACLGDDGSNVFLAFRKSGRGELKLLADARFTDDAPATMTAHLLSFLHTAGR